VSASAILYRTKEGALMDYPHQQYHRSSGHGLTPPSPTEAQLMHHEAGPMSSSRGLPAPLQPQLQHQISSPIAVVPSPDVPVVAAPLERQALWRGAEVHSLEGWDEAKREDAQVRNGEAPRESYLSVAGQTLGKWIWGGLRLVPAASSGSAWLRDDKTAIATTSQTRPYNAASSSSSSFSSSPSPSSSTPPARPPFAQQAVFPRSTTILGEETSMHRQDESLEINWLNGQGRPSVEGSARDEEGALGEEEEGGSQLRTLFASVRNRSRELMGRIENWGLNTKNGDEYQLPTAAEEEEREIRHGHQRGGSISRKQRPSIEEDWTLINCPPQPPALTDEQYAVMVSRQLAEEEECQRRMDEELARRIQMQEDEEAQRQAREDEAAQRAVQRHPIFEGGGRRISHGSVEFLISGNGQILVSEAPDEPRNRRRRTADGLVTLIQLMRNINEMRSSSQELDSQSVVSQNMNYEQMLSLADRIGNVNRGLSEAARDALPTRVHRNKENKNKEDDNCTICLSEYEEGEVLRTLPCLHSYHKTCIDYWLQSHNTCPVCKNQINL